METSDVLITTVLRQVDNLVSFDDSFRRDCADLIRALRDERNAARTRVA